MLKHAYSKGVAEAGSNIFLCEIFFVPCPVFVHKPMMEWLAGPTYHYILHSTHKMKSYKNYISLLNIKKNIKKNI